MPDEIILITHRKNLSLDAIEKRRRSDRGTQLGNNAAMDISASYIWDAMFEELVLYGERNGGNCNVPIDYNVALLDGSGAPLGLWLAVQRQFKRGIGGNLKPDQEQFLQKLVEAGSLSWEGMNDTSASPVIIQPAHVTTREDYLYEDLPDEDEDDDVNWDEMYEELVLYGERNNGDSNVPTGYISESGLKLGAWVARQRWLYRNIDGSLRSDRKEQLERIFDPDHSFWGNSSSVGSDYNIFDEENLESNWDVMFAELIKYGVAHSGDCNLPKSYSVIGPDGNILNIGHWLGRQRQRKKGYGDTLSEVEEAQLQHLVDQGQLSWESNYISTNTSSNHHATHFITGIPPSTSSYTHGFHSVISSTSSDDVKWNRMFDYMLLYGESSPRQCNVPHKFVMLFENGSSVKVGPWLRRQRQLKKEGKLRADRVARLQALAEQGRFAWDVNDVIVPENARWEEMFALVLQYGEEHGGNCNVPAKHVSLGPDGTVVNLGNWLSNQRQKKKGKGHGVLTEDQERKLQNLVDQGKFKWVLDTAAAPDNTKWLRMFEALLQYGQEHDGNCNVPQSHSVLLHDGTLANVGEWLHSQRQNKKGKRKDCRGLRADREAKLQELVDQGRLSWEMR